MFKSECDRFTRIAKTYFPEFHSLHESIKNKVMKKEYAKGGELLSRGYYCPSPIDDIVIGNCKRGRRLKKYPNVGKASYEFCYDAEDKLIIINSLFSNSTEIILYKAKSVLGINVSRDIVLDIDEIVSIIECKYDDDNRITSYINAFSCYGNCNIDELSVELYQYNESGLRVADTFNYLDRKRGGTLNHYQYYFEHDSEGFLKNYRDLASNYPDEIYKVYIKRKI